MWQLASLYWLLLAFSPSSFEAAPVDQGATFGPRETLTCSWFTNFENSRFEKCWIEGRSVFPDNGGASLECQNQSCEELDAGARKVAHWTKSEPPWGTFKVQLVGRVSVHPHKSRYLGDGSYTVLIERILSVEKSD